MLGTETAMFCAETFLPWVDHLKGVCKARQNCLTPHLDSCIGLAMTSMLFQVCMSLQGPKSLHNIDPSYFDQQLFHFCVFKEFQFMKFSQLHSFIDNYLSALLGSMKINLCRLFAIASCSISNTQCPMCRHLTM